MDKKTILVVDDEVMLLKSISRALCLEGYKVYEASSAKIGLELLSKERVDFILSDIQMPDLDGVEFLKRIKEDFPEIPVVAFMTGYTKYDVQDILNLGAIQVFNKPFDIERICETIEQC